MQSRLDYWIEWGWWLLLAIAICVPLLLTGCATLAEDENFMEATARANATRAPNYPPMVIWVDDANRICRNLGSAASENAIIHGCANYSGSIVHETCLVILAKTAPAWVAFHERLHCKYGSWHQ